MSDQENGMDLVKLSVYTEITEMLLCYLCFVSVDKELLLQM